jgi:radical SAM protein with 4Fe4S-binding SPASM domain
MSLEDVRRRLPVVDRLPASKGRGYLPLAEGQRPSPTYAVWELTLACDQQCRACGPRAGRARTNELTTEEALRLVDELAELGVGEVTLIGGEAYLRNDFILILRAIRNAGMKASITTGGLNLTRRRAEAMVEAGVQLVSVSIDGLEVTHDRLRVPGSWQRAISALREVKRAGATIAANTQINRENVGQLEALGDVLAAEGIRSWQMFLTIAHGNAADDPNLVLQPYMLLDVFEEVRRIVEACDRRRIVFWPGNNLGYFGPYEHELRRHQKRNGFYDGCQAGKTGLGIESDCAIKSCPSLGGPSNTGGSWREHGLRAIWERAPQMRSIERRTKDELWGYCRDCYYAETCMAGCTATTEPLFGRRGNNPYCHHRAQELSRMGLRERIEPIGAAPSVPFGAGRFRLICEPTNASERARRGPVHVYEPAHEESSP